MVRRAGIAALVSAAHQKPEKIHHLLGELMPILYGETVVRKDLIHIVDMGPFKHVVDDGLEVRKVGKALL